jgi:NAD(P)-dependent dehydrogenase (short-subunit alcohol dehydrogenase family)
MAGNGSLFDLSGRVAVVTGGNRGIGRAMALGLARAGATVAVLARNVEQYQLVPAELKDIGKLLRSLFVTTLLTSVVLASGSASVAVASEARQALNIGFVLYTKGEALGTLNARWTYQNVYSGKGLATGGPKEGFAGHYHVRYYDEHGKFSDEYDLVIEKAGAFYNASWITDGKVSASGVGMEVEKGLAFGWRRVAD